MGSVIDSDALLRAAYYVTLGACGCTLLLILTIAWLRLSRQLRLRRQAARAADWEPLIALCALEPPAAQPRVKRRHRGAFFELWNHFYDLQRGEGHNHLRQLAGDPRLRAYVSHALRWGGLRSQIIAATTAGHLADPASMPALKPLVHHDSPTLSLAAAKSLMEIDPAANLPWLFPLIAQRVDWPISSVATTLRDLGVGVFAPPLAQAVRDTAETPHESQQLARLLRLTEIARQTHIMPAIRALFERGDALNAEVLAACLRLIVSPDDAHWARR